MILLQHLHVRVVWQTLFANGREVGRFPAAAIQVGLDLGRHVGRGSAVTVEEMSSV